MIARVGNGPGSLTAICWTTPIPGCAGVQPLAAGTMKQAIREIRAEGWEIDAHRMVRCPTCVAAGNPLGAYTVYQDGSIGA